MAIGFIHRWQQWQPRDDGWLIVRRANGWVDRFPEWGTSGAAAYNAGLLRKYEWQAGDCVRFVVLRNYLDVAVEVERLRMGLVPCVELPSFVVTIDMAELRTREP